MTYLLIAAGLLLLGLGGEALLRGAVDLARKARLPHFVIGVVLLGFGTSMPELATSVSATWRGSPGIAVGNVVGSNIANILLILGAAALMLPIACNRDVLSRDGVVLAVTAIAAIAIAQTGELGRLAAALLTVGLIAYVVMLIVKGRQEEAALAALGRAQGEVIPETGDSLLKAIGLSVAGLLMVIVGAGWLVDGSIELARRLGVSEALIGLTMVAVGTSLPELAVSISATLKKQGDVVLGNIIGSNIFNTLGILGVSGLVAPLAIDREFASFDVLVMGGATALLIFCGWTGRRIGRREGALMVLLYGLYIVVRAMSDTGAA